ncbi:MAG: lytic transglycosylase domain-containing protein [Sphaerobacter sp.]|nr:lytic transglycosylase domain-containing protein [Sphaerobacter sp.]
MARTPLYLVSLFVLVVAVIVSMNTPARGPAVSPGGAGWADEPEATVLAAARQRLAEGDAVGAADVAGAIAAQGDAAALLRGRALLASGQPQAALDTLSGVLRNDPPPESAAAACLAAGAALEALGQPEPALAMYRQAAAHKPDIAPYAGLHIVPLLRQTGRTEEALQQALEIAQQPTARRTQVAALELAREIQAEAGDGDGYLATTRRLLDLATIPTYRAELLYQAGQIAQQQGRRDEAVRDLRAAAAAAPDSPYAAQAVDALAAMSAADAVPAEERGLALYHAGRYPEAIAALTAALDGSGASERARYYRGLSRARAGDVAGGVEDLREVARRQPDGPLAAEALLQAARLMEEAGDAAGARAAYEALRVRYPESEAAAEARFRLGLIAYVAGDVGAALRAWSAGGDARVLFWLGKARAAAGDDAGAQAVWEAAARADPNDYYGLRARERRRGEPDLAALTTPRAAPDAGSAGPELWAAVAPWFQAQGVDVTMERAAVESDPGFLRAVTLLDAGMVQEAGWEIQALAEAYAADAPRLVALAATLAARGETAAAARVVARVVDAAGASDPPVPAVLERLRYPIPYREIVWEAARRQAVDPLLLVALVMQESDFNPNARSPAGAVGLAQIVPATGQEIARRLGRTNFEPHDLLRPEVSLEFGAYYLAERLRRFGGNLPAALAAYNAGDAPVTEWLAAPGGEDPDVFTEMIPYPETYTYVRRVYVNYQHYRRLYGE